MPPGVVRHVSTALTFRGSGLTAEVRVAAYAGVALFADVVTISGRRAGVCVTVKVDVDEEWPLASEGVQLDRAAADRACEEVSASAACAVNEVNENLLRRKTIFGPVAVVTMVLTAAARPALEDATALCGVEAVALGKGRAGLED